MFVRELSATLDAAVLAGRLAHEPGLAWLDGAGSAGDPWQNQDGRYSFLGAAPRDTRRIALGTPAPFSELDGLAHAALAQRDTAGSATWGELASASHVGLPLRAADVPLWIGYIAYDAYTGRPAGDTARRAGPALVLARYDALYVLDHVSGRSYVAGDDESACERLLARSSAPPSLGRSSAPPSLAHASAPQSFARASALLAADPAEHARAIAAALELIAAGELYQVNLARRFEARLEGDPLALALAMREASPVPLGFYFDDGERSVIGRSMERFLRWDRATRRLHTRPIKGTLARMGNDAAERRALAQDPKEHAEHAMIVDLMRNDLGRVAEVGSVRVEQCMQIEPFAGLHHLVSTIACRTRPEIQPSDILYATFPPGSVTGTPKLRAIETIAALEAAPRGIYTGAVGFLDRAGGLSLAVAIRTAVVEAGVAEYYAGGGIVEASQIEREIAETELKARVFVDALATLVL